MAKKKTLRFRDAAADFERLRADIAARRFAPLYLLMGEESYFIDALSDLLAATVLDESERAFGQYVVYGRDTEAGAVVNLCRQLPMVGSRQLVIVKEAQQLRQIEKLACYTEAPAPTTVLVLCHKEKNLDKRTALYKGFAERGEVLESVRPRDYEIGEWLARFVGSKGCSIAPKALTMLTDNLGTDIAKISNELEKLLLALPEGTQQITDRHIEQYVGISKDFNNFELCKALLSRDSARALFIADHFARNPKDHPLLLTVSALFAQFRQLFLINYLRWQTRRKGIPFPSDAELMQILKVGNIFAINELKQMAAGWPNQKVFKVLELLRTYDAKSKGYQAGSASDGELLRELLLHITLL